ncbi:unnamed protein product [Amaranthus hypochondriacus]
MASSFKKNTTLALIFYFILLLFSTTTAYAWNNPYYGPSVPSGGGASGGGGGIIGGGDGGGSGIIGGGGGGGGGGSGRGGGGSSRGTTCPVDTLKLGVCANLLGNLLNLQIGSPPVQPCCTLIEGLVDVEAAVCLCTMIRANVLNLVNLDLPVNLTLLLNVCGRQVPRDFLCP